MNLFGKKDKKVNKDVLSPEQQRMRGLQIYFAQNGPFGFDMSAIGFYNGLQQTDT